MAIDPRELLKTFYRKSAEEVPAPFSGTRTQKIQRLQVGLFGLVSMILVVALADIVVSRADQTEASVVSPDAPIAVPSDAAAPRDPLADAGVVPALPAETGIPADGAAPLPSPAPAAAAPLPAGVTAQ